MQFLFSAESHLLSCFDLKCRAISSDSNNYGSFQTEIIATTDPAHAEYLHPAKYKQLFCLLTSAVTFVNGYPHPIYGFLTYLDLTVKCI